MDIEAFRKASYQAVDRICDYYASLHQQPVSAQVQPGFLAHAISDAAPEQPEQWQLIQDDFHSTIIPGITPWQHPNFCGSFPCNTTFEGALADLYCAAISNPGFNWACSPSVTELEILMIDWIAKMLGLFHSFLSTSPFGTGGGIILGSASEVTLTVAIAAREPSLDSNHDVAAQVPAKTAAEVGDKATQDAASSRARSRGDVTSRLVMYGTTQTHTVGSKAALILGLSFRALEVSASDGFGLRGSTLRAAIAEDEAAGRIPFLLIATVGTTNSGAIDNISELASTTRHYPTLWLHVDAAYAGVALSLPELRSTCHLDAINSDVLSFSTNLHKWGMVPFDCSPLFIKDTNLLSDALAVSPAYLPTAASTHRLVREMRNWQIPLGRRFRSLKVWFVLRSYGVVGFQTHLRHSIHLSQFFLRLLQQDEEGMLQLVAPRWAMVVFRLNPPSSSHNQADLENLNLLFWNNLQKYTADFVLTSTVLPEVGTCIRFVVGSLQTRSEHVVKTWNKIRQCARTTWQEFSERGVA